MKILNTIIFLVYLCLVSVEMNSATTKVIIDCDHGIDDILALILAVKNDTLDIKAITTTTGNESIKNTTANTIYVLNMLQDTSIPVYAGVSKHLSRPRTRDYFFGKKGLGTIHVEDLLKNGNHNEPKDLRNAKMSIKQQIKKALAANAVTKILEIIRNNPHQITIVCLGPLTNIARAIEQDAETMNLVKELIITGGTINAPGNIRPHAEFNFYADPEAANIVFKSPIKKKLVSVDAVSEADCTWQNFLDDLGETAMLRNPLKFTNISLHDFIYEMLDFAGGQKILADDLFDPVAIYALTQPVSTYDCHITVEMKDKTTRGKVLYDCSKTPNTAVVHNITKAAFEKFLHACLKF